MLNNAPNDSNYRQGLYIPENKDKVYKLNSKGGVYYRSSWERKVMVFLDKNEKVKEWAVEAVEIPYQLIEEKEYGQTKVSNKRYYPDFFYKLEKEDGTFKKICLEVKPFKQTQPPKINSNKNITKKQLKNYEYDIKEWKKNLCKWRSAIEWCKKKDFDFKILTEKELNKLKV